MKISYGEWILEIEKKTEDYQLITDPRNPKVVRAVQDSQGYELGYYNHDTKEGYT
jgi:hypothetical protein